MQVVPPSKITRKDLQKAVISLDKPDNYKKFLIWIPFSVLECKYTDDSGYEWKTISSINRMFISSDLNVIDLLLLFRPYIHRLRTVDREHIQMPSSLANLKEIFGPILKCNFEEISDKLLRLFYETKELLSTYKRDMKRIGSPITRLFLPDFSLLLESGIEEERINLQSIKFAMKLLIGIDDFPRDLQFTETRLLYFPYLMLASPKGGFRFFGLIKLGTFLKRIKEDLTLSRLANESVKIKEIIENLVEEYTNDET